ncbi:hypothetical protein NHJ13734_004188 [Beauveria thailandica]
MLISHGVFVNILVMDEVQGPECNSKLYSGLGDGGRGKRSATVQQQPIQRQPRDSTKPVPVDVPEARACKQVFAFLQHLLLTALIRELVETPDQGNQHRGKSGTTHTKSKSLVLFAVRLPAINPSHSLVLLSFIPSAGARPILPATR